MEALYPEIDFIFVYLILQIFGGKTVAMSFYDLSVVCL